MALATSFLAGAKSRLLPASVPFRFFGAAVVFQFVGWILLVVGAEPATSFAGGLGWPLAALHAFTLGMLAMTAIGASLQLLPVATRQPVASRRAPALLWWLYTPSLALLLAAMALGWPIGLAIGATGVVAAMAVYGVLLARNLAGARGMPVVVAHGWAALAALVMLWLSALSLVFGYLGYGVVSRLAALAVHVALAAYGFMGLLAMGFSYILVPMFALSDAPSKRPSLASAACAIAGLVLAALAAFGVEPDALWPLAVLFGAAGFAVHVALMRRAMRDGMRRDLGRSFVLVRLGWALLGASLAAALAVALGFEWTRLRTLFGVLLVGGLATFLLGMLARIVPFLASMHAPAGKRGPPLPSSLTAERPLAVHLGCHLAALALLVLAVLADSGWLARSAGLVGAVGAIAFGRFFVHATRRMSASPAGKAAPDRAAAPAPRDGRSDRRLH